MNADLFIDGRWVAGSAGALDNVDPGNGRTVGTVTLAAPEQVAAALDAAQSAFPEWSAMTAAARGEVLKRAAQILRERIDEASDTLLLETGKTRADARGEIQRAR